MSRELFQISWRGREIQSAFNFLLAAFGVLVKGKNGAAERAAERNVVLGFRARITGHSSPQPFDLLIGGPVQNDAERTRFILLHDQDNGLAERSLVQLRSCDNQFTGKIHSRYVPFRDDTCVLETKRFVQLTIRRLMGVQGKFGGISC